MRIREMALITTAALLLTACSDSPSDADIQAAMQPKLEGASCIKAAMFNRFPVTLSDSAMSGTSSANQPAFDALTDAGLLAKSANTYSLTDNGRAAYVQQESGFCYAQGYEIAKIQNIAANPNPMGAAVDKSWVVTVDIRQKTIADWANTPAIEKLARNPENLSEVPKTYTVVVGRLKGEQTLKLIDPRFSIMRGVGVNQAY